jgi:hypothetical protein
VSGDLVERQDLRFKPAEIGAVFGKPADPVEGSR